MSRQEIHRFSRAFTWAVARGYFDVFNDQHFNAARNRHHAVDVQATAPRQSSREKRLPGVCACCWHRSFITEGEKMLRAVGVSEPGAGVRAAAGDGQDEPGGGCVVAGGALHPLAVAALRRHRTELVVQGLYDAEAFVFPTRTGTAIYVSNLRRDFKKLRERSGLSGKDWTTYELRHSFVSLVSDQLGDLTKVVDLAGHADTKTTEGHRHGVRAALPHAVDAWDRLLAQAS